MTNAPALLRLMRPHQWAKNLLVAVPILTGHRWADERAWTSTGLMSLALCAMASALYILNDSLDQHADRLHPIKRARPIAAGLVSTRLAVAMLIGLTMAAIGIAAMVSTKTLLLVSFYGAGSALYSLLLKRIAVADIILLALLYVFRIVAGGVATGIEVSDWLLTFAFFVFLSLAAGKRMSELLLFVPLNTDGAPGKLAARGYDAQDISFVQSFGIASAVGSVVILCLYLQSDIVHKLYQTPRVLWLAIPLFTGWILRLWRLVMRGLMQSDPVMHVLRDPVSYAIGALTAVLVMLARPMSD